MNLETMRQSVITYCMDNPCLSEEIDYQPDEIRRKHYRNIVNDMSHDELINEYVRNNHKIIDDEIIVKFDGWEFALSVTEDDLETHVNDMVNHIIEEIEEGE